MMSTSLIKLSTHRKKKKTLHTKTVCFYIHTQSILSMSTLVFLTF